MNGTLRPRQASRYLCVIPAASSRLHSSRDDLHLGGVDGDLRADARTHRTGDNELIMTHQPHDLPTVPSDGGIGKRPDQYGERILTTSGSRAASQATSPPCR